MLEKFIQKYGAPAGVLCLIIAALLWGGEYVVAKDVLNLMEPNWSNAIRTFFTSILAVIIWRKQFRKASAADWKRGAICGSLFGLAFALQIMGLELINAGINAFISSAYVVLVPFMVWFIEKKRPANKVFVSAFVGILGVSIMSVTGFSTGHLSIGTGEILSLLSAVGYGGTFITQLLFTMGVKYASANQAGVIFPLESVSATVLGCLFLHEQLKAAQVIGGILIVSAIVVSSITKKKASNL